MNKPPDDSNAEYWNSHNCNGSSHYYPSGPTREERVSNSSCPSSHSEVKNSPSVHPTWYPPGPVNDIVDVIIVGAGISGLAAAQVLRRRGLRCVLLEAKDRHGGRIHSVIVPVQQPHIKTENQIPNAAEASKPLILELGANYIHGCVNDQWSQPMFVLASRLGVSTAVTPGDVDRPYRGWENPELAVWRDHVTGQSILPEEVAAMTFLYDTTIQRASERLSKSTPVDGTTTLDSFCLNDKLPQDIPLKGVLESVRQEVLVDMVAAGIRDSDVLTVRECGIFDSLVSRFLAYVNPVERLSAHLTEDRQAYPPESSGDKDGDVREQMARKFSFVPHMNGFVDGFISENHGVIFNNGQALHPKKGRPGKKRKPRTKEENFKILYKQWIEYYLTIWKKKWNVLHSKGPQVEVAKRVHRQWEDRLVLSGYSVLTNKLAEGLDIRYTLVAKRIDWSTVANATTPDYKLGLDGYAPRDNHLVVEAVWRLNPSVVHRFYCRYCLIAVPVGVLKGLHDASRIDFEPPLPLAKRSAINQLGIPYLGAETHDKVIMHFVEKDIFWDRDAPQIKCPDPRLHVLNLDWFGQPGVLLCHVWGGSGLRLVGRTDTEVVLELLALLKPMYASTLAQRSRDIRPDWAVVTRWSEDPYALGSYTEGEIGTSDLDRHAYAASLPSAEHPRLLFCGEGTVDSSKGQQCTHGAFMSGVDRACDILRFHYQKPAGVPLGRIIDFLLTPPGGKMKVKRCSAPVPSPIPPSSTQDTKWESKESQPDLEVDHNVLSATSSLDTDDGLGSSRLGVCGVGDETTSKEGVTLLTRESDRTAS